MLQAAADTFKVCGDEFDKAIRMLWIAAFIAGVDYADRHPKNVWHKASEEPEIGSNIVVVDKNGQWWDIQPYDGEYDGYGGLTGWRCCVAHYNDIQHWAYVNDLLPKTDDE